MNIFQRHHFRGFMHGWDSLQLHIYMPISVHTCMWVHAHACTSHVKLGDHCPGSSSIAFLRQGLSLNVELMGSTGWQTCLCPLRPWAGVQIYSVMPSSLCGYQNLNSVPDVSMESTLLSKPPPQSQWESILPRICNFYHLSTCPLLCLDLRMCYLLVSDYRKGIMCPREGWPFCATDGHRECDQTHT